MSTLYKIGDCIKDIFRVETIMEGGMGVVYICRGLEGGQLRDQVRLKPRKPESESSTPNPPHYAAFKTFHRELLWHPSVEDGFRRECLTWITLLPHPNIVKARTIDLIGAYLHLWLEYVDGGSLRDRLSAGPLALDQTLAIALQSCLGMEFLFQSGPIVHLDIKPENILLAKSGTVKVTDFGLAKALVRADKSEVAPEAKADAEGKDGHGVIAGTVPYMSPEQFNAGEVDVRSDVYAFGVVFYEMLTGRRPFRASTFEDYKHLHESTAPTPPKEFVGMPAEINDAVLKCLEKKPEARWQTFADLRLNLETFCRGNGLERLILPAPSLSSLEQGLTANDWNMRGYALAKLDKYEQSYDCYRRSLELDPEAVGANVNMGTGLKRLGRVQEATPYYEREVQLHPDVAIVHEALATHYMEIGRSEEALATMRKSAELDPEGIARWRTLGFICLKLHREEESRKVWEHIKSLLLTVPRFQNPMTVVNEVIICMNAGANDAALEMHEFGIEHYPDSALIWYNFGVTLQKLDRQVDAVNCYTRALELDNGLTFAALNRSLLLSKMGYFEPALQDLEAAAASDPESSAGQLAATMLDMAKQFGADTLAYLGDLQASLKYIM